MFLGRFVPLKTLAVFDVLTNATYFSLDPSPSSESFQPFRGFLDNSTQMDHIGTLTVKMLKSLPLPFSSPALHIFLRGVCTMVEAMPSSLTFWCFLDPSGFLGISFKPFSTVHWSLSHVHSPLKPLISAPSLLRCSQ